MAVHPPERIRNVAFLGHNGCGKTTLTEALLFTAGVLTRQGRVDDGNTVSDYDPEETKRRISINLSLVPVPWKETKVNILDTPGYADFVGEALAAIRVADAALILVDAIAGVQVGTEQVWQHCDERGLPRAFFVNKLDRENADFGRTVAAIRERFGRGCVPVQLPIVQQGACKGVIDLLSLRVGRGGEAPAELLPQVKPLREQMLEAVAETDDALLSKYLEEGELSEQELRQALRQGFQTGQVRPIFAGCSAQNAGSQELLAAIVDLFPCPRDAPPVRALRLGAKQEEELKTDPAGPLAAFVFKTTADPYVGRLTYVRVYSGTLKSDSRAWNGAKNREERIGQLYVVRGKSQENTPQLAAGDIGAVAKLGETATNDTLTQHDHPLALSPMKFPLPLYSAAVHPKTKADLDKLGHALARLAEEDPTLGVRREPDTSETILSGLGESHIQVTVEKMQRKFGAGVTAAVPKVPYKETITTRVKAEHKHKKQTGGHGQYGHVVMELEPLPRGTGFEFASKVVGGSVPRNYIPAVEKGVRNALPEGPLAHFPLIDLRAVLVDGSYHDVDSSDMSFQIAGAQALRHGVAEARPVILEPVVDLRVRAPDSYTGEIIGDLNSKRARVHGMTPEDGHTIIEAEAPLAELQRYATDLRSLTQGRGTFTIEFSHYEEVPAHQAPRVIEAAQREREAAQKD
ncbi:MAG: elongation factor G [Chloroflexi bacterium]|nr:elongation factor G [Chloroflexota bacterium]